MLTSIDITNILKNEKSFHGVYSISDLPVNLLPKLSSLVINLDERWKIGSHWVAIYFPVRGPVFFFVSFGREPSSRILALTERNSSREWIFNTKKIQGDLSTLCGYCCIEFIKKAPKFGDFLRKFKNCSKYDDQILIKKIMRI